MKSVTVDISRLRGVVVGDFLLSVDGVSTNSFSKSALDALLLSNFVSCQFVTRTVYESNTSQSTEQLSLTKNGFYAQAHLGRLSVLKSVTTELSRLRAVGIGDFLLSVDGVSTTLFDKSALDTVLLGNFVSCEFVTRAVYESKRSQSTEQLSLNRHGFYAKGTY